MEKIWIPILMATATALASCDDFLSAYSQDQIVAKEVKDLDEVILGSGYLQSTIVTNGPQISRTAGFFNILDDDVNTGRDLDGEGIAPSTFVAKAWLESLQGNYGSFGWQQDVGSNWDGTNIYDDAATWNSLYEHINVVNVILDEIQGLPHHTEDTEAAFYRVQGEAHFLRGQFYFTLANLYGDMYETNTAGLRPCVPIKLTPNVEFKFERASVLQVYEQVIQDLTLAEEYLTRSPQNESHLLHRASVEAVDLLLSRVYLYMQEWELAEEKADNVMRSENFYLSSIGSITPNTPYLTDENPDIIFSQGSNSLSSTNFFTARPGDYCVSKELYDLYGEGDARKSCFFSTYHDDELAVIANDSIMLNAKYERGNSIRAHISDVFTLRVSEAYLNKMEALAMQGKNAEANELLNKFRNERIYGHLRQDFSGEDLVNEIRDERRKELCFEGHRWFDLRRYAVNTQYPLHKNIIHVFNVVGDNVGYMYSRTLVLPAGDKSYTFAIPKSVMDFFTDGSMTTNPREERLPLENSSEEGNTVFPSYDSEEQ